MYFYDSNVPKCSSHLCCIGSNFASHSLLTSSLHIHTVTLKYVCASAASYPNNVYDYPFTSLPVIFQAINCLMDQESCGDVTSGVFFYFRKYCEVKSDFCQFF